MKITAIYTSFFGFIASGAVYADPVVVQQHASDKDFYITVKDYPEDARKAGDKGHATFSFVVSADGNVVDCTIVQSSGSIALDKQSCAIAERTSFRPAKDTNRVPVNEKWYWGFNWVNPQRRDIVVDRPTPMP